MRNPHHVLVCNCKLLSCTSLSLTVALYSVGLSRNIHIPKQKQMKKRRRWLLGIMAIVNTWVSMEDCLRFTTLEICGSTPCWTTNYRYLSWWCLRRKVLKWNQWPNYIVYLGCGNYWILANIFHSFIYNVRKEQNEPQLDCPDLPILAHS